MDLQLKTAAKMVMVGSWTACVPAAGRALALGYRAGATTANEIDQLQECRQARVRNSDSFSGTGATCAVRHAISPFPVRVAGRDRKLGDIRKEAC